jgi:hypothetical protein
LTMTVRNGRAKKGACLFKRFPVLVKEFFFGWISSFIFQIHFPRPGGRRGSAVRIQTTLTFVIQFYINVY